VVSSLIGHSLDALSTGLPTVQVLHDFYPAWPLLGIHPEPFLREGRPAALSSALDRHRLLDELSDYDADEWSELGRAWRERVQQNEVRLAAPSRSVADLLRRLDPGWSGEEVAIIPHGLPRLAAGAGIIPRDRDDGRLRLVIPGRIQEGKGQKLLLEALPELTRHAQVCLLGAGKCGEVFFGQSGVDVIVQYRRDELPALLATIGPHAAALLSVVPETFSYTLSEMFQLQIPVIATRVGSLAERVRDGENGWLIEPTADALVDAVRSLSADRSRLAGLRERMANIDLPDAADMAAAYDRLCPPDLNPRQLARAADQGAIQAAALASQLRERQRESDRLAEDNEQLQDEIEKRTQWAEERERARRQEVERRIRWVEQLEAQLSDTTLALQQSEEELHTTRETLEREQGMHRREQGMHRQTGRELDQLRATHEWVLGSLSWRATRPFRVAARFASNLGRAGAWNPLKWPAMLAHATRTIRTRGWRGALLRSQLSQQTYPAERLDTSGVEAVGDAMAPAGFPAVVEPDVSIVVPVHNQWTYTAACLRSLLQARCSVTFEVIVVDDLSTDETPGQLESIDGLVHLRNDENLGFVGSCQRGAAAAQGRYIVLLNNDTQVLDGWLDSLLDTFEQHPNTGLAGSRLIYPDGRLQEAGGIIFSDGSGWNYGKGANPDHPEYQFAREVDYCSGACIMLPASLYRELGGFDERYAPAYYEDTDLAFRVREAGYEVRVQPASTIVHHEGVTSGTDLSSGIKRHQVINRETFVERWAETLARHPAPIVDPRDEREIRRARDHHLKGRILIVDAYTPEPDQDSGSLRLRYLMRCFQKLGYGVTFLPDNRAFAGDYTTALQAEGIEAVYDPFVGTLQRFFSERGAEFRFIMISRHYVASKYLALMKRYCPDARFIFDTVDLHYLREERQAELENSLPLRRTAAQTRRSELAVIRSADATLVVSPVEKTVLEEAAPEAPVHVISNVHEVVGSRRPFGERQDIFFVGGYQHPPNVDAALWFTRSIWPRIHEALPDIEFHLIGSKAPEQVRGLQGDGVRFQGFVEDLEPWLDGCRIAVAPLRYGAGIKGKVNISMSRGQPVVATPMAVEGMFAKPGRDVLVAETADAFADEVIRLYSDEELWNRVSVSGLENVRQYFSVETARLGLQGLIQSLESGK
jgi:GT2 family glycosyltransferase